MKNRILSTAILWAIVICVPWLLGTVGAMLLLVALGLAAQAELYRLLTLMGFAPLLRFGLVIGAFILLGTWFIPSISGLPDLDAGTDVFIVALVILCFLFLSRPDLTLTRSSILPTLLGILLVPFMLSFYVRLARHFELYDMSAAALLCPIWIIAVAKFTDVGGLLAGMRWGRNRLAPSISPGKTWEGVIGGVILATIVGAILLLLFRSSFPANFTLFKAILFAVPIAMISVVSDLIESVLKRQAEVKDSGSFIPGIGGALDLTDSLLLSAPVGYLLFKYFVF